MFTLILHLIRGPIRSRESLILENVALRHQLQVLSQHEREVIQQMVASNPNGGVPRIHGELLKPGIEVSKRQWPSTQLAGTLHRRDGKPS